MDREDAELSASEYQQRALANADHLGILHSRWADLAGKADRERYHQLVNDALPEEYRQDDFGPEATWLWRDLRAAEMAGLDAGEVIRAAVNSNTLAGIRSMAGVLHKRMSKIVDPLVPLPQKPWTDRPRAFPTPKSESTKPRFGRRWTPGPNASANTPYKPRPRGRSRPSGRCPRIRWSGWTGRQRASKIATYRELYGIDDEHEVIGHEPTGNAPEMRAAWHDAFAAITKTDARWMSGPARQSPDAHARQLPHRNRLGTTTRRQAAPRRAPGRGDHAA